MPRGRRRSVTAADAEALERELADLKARQVELRKQLRLARGGGVEVRKLEEKLEKQLATARWTAQQIRELQPEWDELGFYESVQARQPAPRGRRPRQASAG